MKCLLSISSASHAGIEEARRQATVDIADAEAEIEDAQNSFDAAQVRPTSEYSPPARSRSRMPSVAGVQIRGPREAAQLRGQSV